MPSFDDFLMRHGEAAIYDLLSRWERFEGIKTRDEMPLEDRWASFAQTTLPAPTTA